MINYWPPQSRSTGSETFLWQHEWQDHKGRKPRQHGWDYAELLLRVQPHRFKGLSGKELERALQYAFFKDTIAFYKKYSKVIKYPSKDLTKDSFARVLKANGANLQPDQITIACAKNKNIVREVKVCFDVTPNGHVFRTCSKNNTDCPNTDFYVLPEWEESTQDRVIDLYRIGNDL